MEGKSLKNIRASTGFEPVASAIPERCSTNWAVKPLIGSEVNLLTSYLPVQWNDVKYIYIKFILYCGCRWSLDIFQASSFQLLKLENLLGWSLFTVITIPFEITLTNGLTFVGTESCHLTGTPVKLKCLIRSLETFARYLLPRTLFVNWIHHLSSTDLGWKII